MRLAGHVFKTRKFWAIEVPILGIVTQGRTKREAYEMISDAIESLVNKEGFEAVIHPGEDQYFEISFNDLNIFVAFLLRRLRKKQGLTLMEVSKLLGAKSHNTYARYEQGRSIPTIEKFNQLVAALSPDNDFVLMESKARYGKKKATPKGKGT
jgi:predicted RNase H-like HicB family nuclease